MDDLLEEKVLTPLFYQVDRQLRDSYLVAQQAFADKTESLLRVCAQCGQQFKNLCLDCNVVHR
jgi:hypothetical protein